MKLARMTVAAVLAGCMSLSLTPTAPAIAATYVPTTRAVFNNPSGTSAEK